ncbi:MAG: glycoside hydrolase family 3 N-terminal domain-containing protein [Gaiellales bacterium]
MSRPHPYRDLNRNGRLDPYEDPRVPVEQRVDDLLARMTVAEKVGLMFQPWTRMNRDGTIARRTEGPGLETATQLVGDRAITHLHLLFDLAPPRRAAVWQNRIQRLAEETRLGIPVTLSSDPRHGVTDNPGAGLREATFSRWPEPIGLGATGDTELVRAFADAVRQEYTAVGIRLALHPMADLATEPRWARTSGTFGSDPTVVAAMTGAYVEGLQGPALGPESVACMTKHFPGGGPQEDGEDPHFSYGRNQVYPGGALDLHLAPFRAALAAGTAQVMPYYGVPVGLPGVEELGFAFNREIIAGLLRSELGFDGVVCADWKVLTDATVNGGLIPAKCWGVDELDLAGRIVMALDAGIDQFGGEHCTDVLVELVHAGRVGEERIDVSARRLLRDKFRLGLFDDPFVDPARAAQVVGAPQLAALGAIAQRRSIVLLENRQVEPGGPRLLPVAQGARLYVEGVDPAVAGGYGQVVRLEDASVALIRVKAPFEHRSGSYLEQFFHAGDLRFPDDVRDCILGIAQRVPTILDVHLDRPAVMPELAAGCTAVLGSFGSDDEALLDVVFGKHRELGALPFELPSSMEAVARQLPDIPDDSVDPLYPRGYGLSVDA